MTQLLHNAAAILCVSCSILGVTLVRTERGRLYTFCAKFLLPFYIIHAMNFTKDLSPMEAEKGNFPQDAGLQVYLRALT